MRTGRTLAGAALALWAAFALPAGAQDEAGLAGRFLVAEPSIADPRFAETVIYIVSHDDQGAFGLIVNRPLGRAEPEAVYDRLGLDAPDAGDPIEFHFGGPVEGDVGFVLHSREFMTDQTLAVDDGLAVSGIRRVLEAIATGEGPDRAIFALGYSGWGPGQLEREMARTDWVTIEGDPALVFDMPMTERWRTAQARRGLDL
jgi:putative transcriptional regulator